MVKNKTRKCKIKCEDVKCGESSNKCSPTYCYPGGSKSWTKCNMKNWKGKFIKNKKYCKKEKCPKKTSKNSIIPHKALPKSYLIFYFRINL